MKAELIDVMGDDIRVVNAARVSFDKESDWEYHEIERIADDGLPVVDRYDYDVELSEKDQNLLKYLASHNHWTPFSHVMITMRETVPIFVARQTFKHQVGVLRNEVSRRYVDDAPEFFVPKVWRKRAENKKQGSSDEIVDPYDLIIFTEGHEGNFGDWECESFDYEGILNLCKSWYDNAIQKGVAPEQARMVLPQSMYTSYYTTASLAAWARMVNLRTKKDTQEETRELANMWNDTISNIKELENSWKALTE